MSIISRILILSALYGLLCMSVLAAPIEKEMEFDAVLRSTPRSIGRVSRQVECVKLSPNHINSVLEVAEHNNIDTTRSTPRRCLAEDAARRGDDHIRSTPRRCLEEDVARREDDQIRSTPRHVEIAEEERSTP
ncbi:hypothetical protein VKT23_013777 [Stygiomarasmius scandens]|uniref:Uncharacterized protein n=1 Tax=Marasmiellus scandens TaxID=2682957 RepID=A0ABR1J2L7_9AGAR